MWEWVPQSRTQYNAQRCTRTQTNCSHRTRCTASNFAFNRIVFCFRRMKWTFSLYPLSSAVTQFSLNQLMVRAHGALAFHSFRSICLCTFRTHTTQTHVARFRGCAHSLNNYFCALLLMKITKENRIAEIFRHRNGCVCVCCVLCECDISASHPLT